MKPLQTFLPLLKNMSDPAYELDTRLALKNWNGESLIWQLPDLAEPYRWLENGVPILAVPAFRFDRIDVFHVDKNGAILGRELRQDFPTHVDGLLDLWLNSDDLDFYARQGAIVLHVPKISKRGRRYRRVRFPLHTPSFLSSNFESKDRFVERWPELTVQSNRIASDSTSAGRYEQFFLEAETMDYIPQGLRPFVPAWDAFGSYDVRTMFDSSTESVSERLAKVQDLSLHGVVDRYCRREQVWFYPLQTMGVEEVLAAAEAELNVVANSIQELKRNPMFIAKMADTVKIRTALGAKAFFYALLLDRLENHVQFRSCQKCGRSIQGKKGKRFCGLHDNRECYVERSCLAKRRSRQKQTMSPIRVLV